MISDFIAYIKNELKRTFDGDKKCAHGGESGDYCGKCGADLRKAAKYECRFCTLRGRITVYKPDDAPDFCRKCGAPKFTFSTTKKKPSKTIRSGGEKP